MIRGPWPLSPGGMTHDVPLEVPFLTPMFGGERVALRVSREDERRLTRGRGFKGTIVDLDDGKAYALFGMPCQAGGNCCCDAEIFEADAAPREAGGRP